jgi:glycosyltransferase involved in cell wall biosynthesis
MPTRTDAQGVMMCEMATFGMPVITSDMDVCHEVLGEFDNVRFIQPDNSQADIVALLNELEEGLPYAKNNKYFNNNTSGKELELILSIGKK